MVGGAPDDVERVRPLLDLLGRAAFTRTARFWSRMKCINNTITAMTFLATCEGLARQALSRPSGHERCAQRIDRRLMDHRQPRPQRILSRTFDDRSA
jgi:hypothetical protein